jgi:hypothetical protein
MKTLSFAEVLSLLPGTENPKQTYADGVPYILHEDHRWLLPLAHFAQQQGMLPKPCTIIMFDRHHDALEARLLFFFLLVRIRFDCYINLVALFAGSLTCLPDPAICFRS